MKKAILLSFLLLTACSSNSVSDDSKDISANCDDPQIKGNLTTYNGEKIYHMPSGAYYDRTDAEEMFCTEEEAEEAGYRASQR